MAHPSRSKRMHKKNRTIDDEKWQWALKQEPIIKPIKWSNNSV